MLVGELFGIILRRVMIMKFFIFLSKVKIIVVWRKEKIVLYMFGLGRVVVV